MNAVIWIGAAITLVGLAGLVWCIRLALAARAEQNPETRKLALHRVLVWNMAGFGVAAIGLMIVVIAIILH